MERLRVRGQEVGCETVFSRYGTEATSIKSQNVVSYGMKEKRKKNSNWELRIETRFSTIFLKTHFIAIIH